MRVLNGKHQGTEGDVVQCDRYGGSDEDYFVRLRADDGSTFNIRADHDHIQVLKGKRKKATT